MARLLRSLLPLVLVSAALAEAPKPASQLSFLRTEQLPNQIGALQTLSAEYKPATGTGPSVWLIGVAHLGTTPYYTALQKRLDAQNAVLFEGIGAQQLAQGAKPDTSDGLQGQLANALGLKFQLDAIDYHRAHFVNTDMTADGLNQAMERRATESSKQADALAGRSAPSKPKKTGDKPEKVDNETFNQLMQAIHGEGDMAKSMAGMITLMGSTPEMRETTKLMLIEALGQAGELIDLAKAASPEMKDLFEVLITERNEQVMRQLKAQVARLHAGQSVAIFYGAAHMDEIARRLGTDFHYLPAGGQWDTAFTADAAKSIMPAAQMKMMMQMMRTQLQNPAAAGKDAVGLPLLNLFQPSGK